MLGLNAQLRTAIHSNRKSGKRNAFFWPRTRMVFVETFEELQYGLIQRSHETQFVRISRSHLLFQDESYQTGRSHVTGNLSKFSQCQWELSSGFRWDPLEIHASLGDEIKMAACCRVAVSKWDRLDIPDHQPSLPFRVSGITVSCDSPGYTALLLCS